MKLYRSLILLLLILTFLTSCTTSSTHNRGSLSGAMDKSRDENEGDREVPDEDDSSWWTEDDEDPDEDESEDQDDLYDTEDATRSPSEPMTLNVLLRGGRSLRARPYFSSDFNGEILIGDRINHWEVYLFGGFDNLNLYSTHALSESIKDNSFALYAGLEGRYYMFPDLQIFSPFALARIGGLYLFWEFQNALTSGDDTIKSDILGGLLLGAGLGVDLYHGEAFRVGVTMIPEVYLFGEETSQGFTNDYFSSQGFIRWGLEAGARF
ncbi:hypothetical protein [Oceanispirochaeta sp.]|jgi:hypothetical protein|uniref:hypothetical protein n=1 Tax=Oceanispirochaeta sp. TaxID=2035350 RepID=UPI0026236C2B|nr:hypothetical protein [Oceanispirochaeta sp.]MDA3958190.1 hypothetical protein [Oceanispirochaeta sp.]